MSKSSRRRRRTTRGGTATTTTIVLSAATAISITATMNNIQVCNSQYDDPAAAPSLHHHHHHHQVVDDDGGVNHHNNNNDNNQSTTSIIIPPSSHTLSTVFTCGQPNDWRSSQSCSTLCPSGLDSDCPDGTVCYAGIPCLLAAGGDEEGITSADDNEQFMMKKLEEQTALEKRQMARHQRLNRQHESTSKSSMIDKFVCGTSYEHATTSCATRNQLTTQGTLHPFATKAIYCPSGGGGGRNNKECPHEMECYIVSCPRELDGTKSSTLGQYVFDTNDNLKLVVEDVTSWVIEWSQEWYNTMMERWDDDDDLEEDDESMSRLTIWNEWKRSFRDGHFLLFSSSSSSAGLN